MNVYSMNVYSMDLYITNLYSMDLYITNLYSMDLYSMDLYSMDLYSMDWPLCECNPDEISSNVVIGHMEAAFNQAYNATK